MLTFVPSSSTSPNILTLLLTLFSLAFEHQFPDSLYFILFLFFYCYSLMIAAFLLLFCPYSECLYPVAFNKHPSMDATMPRITTIFHKDEKKVQQKQVQFKIDLNI